ncbi:unnamed protein product [Calypogeia fissa]
MRILDMVRLGPYSATRVRPPSSGVIGIATSRCLGTQRLQRMVCRRFETRNRYPERKRGNLHRSLKAG